MKKTIFVLGAPDPEMRMIEKILSDAARKPNNRIWHLYATKDRKRVIPSTAYAADGLSDLLQTGSRVVFVECRVLGLTPYKVIDHHFPGDPGYGGKPKEFLTASSVGQVIAWLAEHYALPPLVPCGRTGGGDAGCFVFWEDRGRWSVSDWDVGAEIPEEIALVAAADHCLGAAYQGRCPGVDPGRLLYLRANQKAEFLGVSLEKVLQNIESTRAILREIATAKARREPPKNAGMLLDLGALILPELPEAACVEGVAYVTTVMDGDRRKRVLGGCTTPDLVRQWMFTEGKTLVDVYGDPDRGFAGGYLQ